jgi:DNA-binding transcriptional ArsR family regulator
LLDSYIVAHDNTHVDVFQALADPVRRCIVERLADAGEASAGQLAEAAHARFGITQPTTSKHLKALREAGLVTSTVAAQRRVYRLDPRPLAELAEWATRQYRYWNLKFDLLSEHLLAHARQPGHPHEAVAGASNGPVGRHADQAR